jgi:ABC-type Zn uptake system ZnuABC Zn-binding protein ZnuA
VGGGVRRWSSTAGMLGMVGLLIAGCVAAPAERSHADTGVEVVTSMSVLADFARQVGGEHVEVSSLVPMGGDPHAYEPTPSDARALRDADVVLGNGVGLEPWFDALIAGSGRDVVVLTERIAHLAFDDGDGEPDPHLWMVPPQAVAYVEAVAAALAEVDPDHAQAYAANAAAYVQRLEALDVELADTLSIVPPDRRVLVTSHDAYTYFAAHYGFEVDTVVGISTDEEPGAGTVQRLIDRVREQQVPTVFVETTVDPAVVERIAADAGAEVGAPLYGDSVGEPGSGAETYERMMRANVDALVAGLAGR